MSLEQLHTWLFCLVILSKHQLICAEIPVEFRLDKTESLAEVKCLNCEADQDTCNTGECMGQACVVIEVTNKGRTSTRKGCSSDVETELATKAWATAPDYLQEGSGSSADRCQYHNLLTGLEAVRCICASAFCNSDEHLIEFSANYRRYGVSAAVTLAQRDKRTGRGSNDSLSAITANNILMLFFICLFLVGAFAMLMMNTVCIH